MILTIEDSWQEVRLFYALKGQSMTTNSTTTTTTTSAGCGYESPAQSLFDMFFKSKSNYQKKAYHCIKTLVQLFSK